MKLYEVLNENYDRKVIKFLEHGKNVYFKIKNISNIHGLQISVLLSISKCDVMMKFVDEIKERLGK